MNKIEEEEDDRYKELLSKGKMLGVIILTDNRLGQST